MNVFYDELLTLNALDPEEMLTTGMTLEIGDPVAQTLAEFSQAYNLPIEEVIQRNNLAPDALLTKGKRLQVTDPPLPANMLWGNSLRTSYQMLIYLCTGFFLCIVVSLVTPRVSKEKLDRVFNCLRTPVDESEPHAAEPFMLPEGMEPATPRKLINHPDFEIPVPSKEGALGFVLLWACVGVMIGFVFWMATWGT